MRCFVALMPPPDTVAQIKRCMDEFSPALPSARRVATDDLHLTLAFLGAVQPENAQAIAAALARLEANHFPSCLWTLERLGAFPKPQVLWLGGNHSPALQHYFDVVRAMLIRLEINFDARPFVPHVTIFRKVRSATVVSETDLLIPWPLTRPVLMASLATPGTTRYRLVKSIS